MIGIDANILVYSFVRETAEHDSAQAFLADLAGAKDVAISEFTLAEFYMLLRNPAVLKKPLQATEAVEVINAYRNHPLWRIPGFPPGSRELHEKLWQHAAVSQFPRRRLYDYRTALSLIAFGVTQFATANVKDFEGVGFQKVWNPLTQS